MLITRFDRVTQVVAELGVLKQQATNAVAFATRAKQLEQPSARLEILAHVAEQLQHRGVTLPLDRNALANIRMQWRALADAYRASPQSIIDVADQRYTFQRLQNLPEDVEKALIQGWSLYVNDMLPPRQPELYQTLERLPGFNAHVAEIERLHHEADRLGARLPQSDEEIARVAAIVSELKAELAHLAAIDLRPDVRDFLAAAVEGGARLEQFTTAVEEWLKENNLVDNVRITLKA